MLKKKIIIIFLITILIITFVYLMYSAYKYSSISYINLNKYEPFNKNNEIIKIDTNFKLEDNFPKMEVASSFYPLASSIIQNICDESMYDKNKYSLVSTDDAFADILEKKADCIIVSAPSDEQKEKIRNSKVNLNFIKISQEELVFYVNNKNEINNLNIEDIKKIYEEKSNWKDYGGKNKTITTYQLEKNNGSQTAFESIVKNNTIDENHKEVIYMEDIINDVGIDKSGIGYSFKSFYTKMMENKNTKLININEKSVEDDDYPLKYDVYFIYRENCENENVKKMAEWLISEEGKEVIDKIGEEK